MRGFVITSEDTSSSPVETVLSIADGPTAEAFRLLVQSVEDYAIFMLDPAGRVMTWNRGAQRIKGYAAHEIIGRHFSVFYGEEDRAARKPDWELEVAARDGRVEDEGFRIRNDGTRFWANVVITVLRDESGAIQGFGKVTRDLTERRRAAEDLRRSDERFRLLVEGVIDYAIYLLDPQGRVSTWNSGAQRIKGYRPAEIIGQYYARFFTPEDVAAGRPELELESARTVGRFQEEGFRVRKNGEHFWANVVLTALRDGNGELIGFTKITRDLTARRRAEETTRTLLQEQAARAAAEATEWQLTEERERYKTIARIAEEASRVKDEFLATVSHELRTPLNAMLGWASLLGTNQSDPLVLKGLEVIRRNAQVQGKIIDDILDVSRIITGKLRLDANHVDLIQVVRHALDMVLPTAAAKGITVNFSELLPEALLTGDSERLQQVTWNLLSNAIKFTGSAGTVNVSVTRSDALFELRVSDDGRGIEPDFLPFVFDRFRQADSSSTRRIGGLGLGLAIVRHLVELHGGRVSVSSPGLGQGAAFTVALPVQARPSGSPQARLSLQPVEGAGSLSDRSLAGLRLLVVEDEPDARDLLQAIMQTAGAIVEAAASADTAFVLLQRVRPDILVSDIAMPQEDGYSLMRRIRALGTAHGGSTPAIALTAYARVEDKAAALAAGFTAHVGKPIQPDELVAAVLAVAATRPKIEP